MARILVIDDDRDVLPAPNARRIDGSDLRTASSNAALAFSVRCHRSATLRRLR
jgi:hypothetical protein